MLHQDQNINTFDFFFLRWMSTLLWKRVLDPKVLFIEFSDVGGSPQGKVGLLQLVLRHRHLHRDVVGLSELVLGLEVADDEGHQVG